eukprot:gi/632985143/ref/XP_007909512.1/ PREDICTED: tetratricopeptide repeat protein 19, mitochondrial isoform X1 [Callorhinchus milii]
MFAAAAKLQMEEENPEDRIVFLIKKAKLSTMKGDVAEADLFLHQALHLAQEAHNTQAISYIYIQMANLSYIRGNLQNAEKLFKAAMTSLVGSGSQLDDNALVEMSLKLASIYATQKQHELATQGYRWCIDTLEEKLHKQASEPLPAEVVVDTQLLLGLCLDSFARYLIDKQQLKLAQSMYERALAISQAVQGERHPQTVLLMNDLAAVLDMTGQQELAFQCVSTALQLARETEHPHEHILLNNLAGILLHRGDYTGAKRVYGQALRQAEEKQDKEAIQHIHEGLAELGARTQSV